MKSTSRLIAFFTLIFISISCNKELESDLLPNQNLVSKDSALLDYISKIGFNVKNVKDIGEYFLVEDDILFPKKMVIPNLKRSKVNQYYTGSLISFGNQNNIRVSVDASLSDWSGLISDAVNVWNSNYYNGPSRIKFNIVTSGTSDIVISKYGFEGQSYCGDAVFANSGNAGNSIRINQDYLINQNFSYEQRRRTVIHELGHAIGFRHTNYASTGEGASNSPLPGNALDVPGYGGTDSGSLMNGGQCGYGATIPSDKDKNAEAALYPTDQPYSLNYSNSYPKSIGWNTPMYTAAGSISSYEITYQLTHYSGSPINGSGSTQSTSFQFPFSQGQYSGGSLTTNVRAIYSNGYISDWTSYNTTLN